MLTPFTEPTKEAPQGAVDYDALAELVQWYKENGVSGLFAVCQSSEMFYLSLEERVGIARFVKEQAGDIPVIASGHISDRLEDQAEELNRMALVKRLVTPTRDLSFSAVYEPFSRVPAERVLSPEMIGITDALFVQVRNAAYLVGTGAAAIDDVVRQYGSLTQEAP